MRSQLDQARAYFSLLHPTSADAASTLWTLPGELSEHLPSDPDRLAARALELAATKEVYVGLLPRRLGLPRYLRGGKKDLLPAAFLWIDLDLSHGKHNAKNLPDLGQALELLSAANLPEPSLTVDSGGGLHCYWLLDAAVPPEEIDRACKALQSNVRALARVRNLHVDQTGNADRVLRVPGTWNRKNPAEPRPVLLLDAPGTRYPLPQLVPSAPSATTSSAAGGSSASPQGVSPASASPPLGGGAGGAEGTNQLLDEIRAFLRRTRGDSAELARAILDGRSIAPRGERDQALQRAASLVTWIAPEGAEPEEMARLLFPTCDLWAAEPDAEKSEDEERAKAVDKCRRAHKDALRKRAQREQVQRDLQRALRREARATAQPAAAEELPDEDDIVDDPDALYTRQELSAMELQHGALDKRWVVQSAGAHYVLVGGEYRSPIPLSDINVSLPRDLAPAPIDWFNYTAKPPRKKTGVEVLQDHSVVARGLVADLTITQSRYDERSQIFYEAAGRRRPLVPKADEAVDRWLRLLGGAHADKLLDWVASVTRLDRQCCALYLSKSTGTGKTMLAHGLARIWTTGGPTELGRVVDQWNADLLRCPLVVADEALPANWQGQRASGELRAFVGASARTVTRKHLPNVECRGATRLMLLANDKQMIALNEDLGKADMQAIAGRFLHIPTSEEAAAFLSELGGPARGTRGWVDDDIIARHALWLAEHRQVIPGTRFLVEGEADKMHRSLIIGSRMGGLICEFVVKWLTATTPPKGPIAVRAGDGMLLVSTLGLAQQWRNLIDSDPVPSITKIGKQVHAMSSEEARFGGSRYRLVDPAYVIDWSEQNQVGDPDQIRDAIARRLPQATVTDLPRRGAGQPQGEIHAEEVRP